VSSETAVASASRPRLLFLCQTLPFPPDSGVAIRTYNVLRLLAERFEVTALCFYRRRKGVLADRLAASIDGLRELATVEVFPIPQEYSRARLIWDHVRSVSASRVYTDYVHASAAFSGRLRDVIANQRPQIVHVDSLDLVRYLPMIAQLPVVCVHHNVESALLARRARIETSRLKRTYLAHQARLMAKAEREWCPKVSLNVCVSQEDAASLQTLAPGGKYCVVPNGVDVELFSPGKGDGRGLVFVGGTTWFPNRDALEYFATDILPIIRQRVPDVTVSWVGRATEDEQRHYRDVHGIDVTGYVDDIRDRVHHAACYVVPLRVGGGTRLKILDGWAMGMPMVSTSIGAEGLDAQDGVNILLRDEPQTFADAVCRVLADAALRKRLATAARATAVESYSWTTIGRAMIDAYDGVLRGTMVAR
jgi:glycosyltransferase involved in cell wall biosynthesis